MSQLTVPSRSQLFAAATAFLVAVLPVLTLGVSSQQMSELERRQAATGGRDVGAARVWNVPEAVEQAPYTVMIDGETLPLEPAGKIVPAYYVRFQLNQPLTLHVKVSLKAGDALNLQPTRYREGLKMNDDHFTLAIHEPGPRVIMMESPDGHRHTPLIILPEKPGAWDIPPHAGAFHDVTQLAGQGPQAPITASLQEILDVCGAADQGGMVYFGPGVYYTAGLTIGDNTMIYLAPGAILYAVPDPEVFRGKGPFLFFNEASNSGLMGYGTVDGNGHIIRGTGTDVSVALVRFRKVQDAYIEGVTLRNAAGWGAHIIGCDRVKVDGVRVFGDWGVKNTDGIDPDSSTNVQISNVFVYGSDDSICVKTTNWQGVEGPTRAVEIRDSMVMSLCTPLKLGTESSADIQNVLFENIDVVHSARGIALWMRDGATYSDVTFRNIRMDVTEGHMRRFPYGVDASAGEPFRICIQDREGGGDVRDILIEDVTVTAPYRAVFTGRDGSTLKGVTLRNIDWRVTPAIKKTYAIPLTAAWVVDKKNELPVEGNPLLVIHRAEDVVFDNVTIDWSEVQDGPWDRFLDNKQSTGIDLDGVEHVSATDFASSAMETMPESGLTWQFGAAQGRDGDGSFILSKTSKTNGRWSVEPKSLRFRNDYVADNETDERNYTEAAAVIDMAKQGWKPGQDFSLILDMEMSGVGDWNRIGLLALAPDMTEHKYEEGGFYHGQLRVQGHRVYHLRLSDGFTGNYPLGTTPSPSRIEDGTYRLVLSGAYDEQGALQLRTTVEREGADLLYTQSQKITKPLEGTHFGVGGTFKAYGNRQPVVDFRSLRFIPNATDPPPVKQGPVEGEGVWTWKGKEFPFRVRGQQLDSDYKPLPTVAYLKGLDIPRIGTDPDEAIVSDLLDDGLVVVELHASGLTSESPEMEEALLKFHKDLPVLAAGATHGQVQIDVAYLYTVPAGYRLARNLPYWNIEKHGVHGSLDRVLEIYNTRVVDEYGAERVEKVEDLRGRDGDPFDYNLYIDVIYPSGQVETPVPLIAHFATIDRMPLMFRAMKRRLYPIGWLTSGYAVALIDHVYHPAARVRYYGHFGPFTLDPWNGVAAGSAAIRFLRAHAEQFNLGDRIGAFGHSKSSYTVMRLADPRHPDQQEHAVFRNVPPGTPEPQPWPGYDSRVDVAYASMGIGIEWVEYTNSELVPLVVAAGRHDQFRFWDKTPIQVERAREYDLNQLTLWMENVGHTFPQDRDYLTGEDETLLVRRFFDQHLHPLGDERLRVLAVVPAEGRQDVELDGTVPRFDVPRDQYPKDLRGLSPDVPITVRFARSIDLEAVSAPAFEVIHITADEQPVPGIWTPSMRNSEFTFTPDQPLTPGTEYAVLVRAGVRDVQGHTLEETYRRTFRTRQ